MPKLKRAKISHLEGKPHVLDLKEIAKWVKEAGGIFRDVDLDFIQWSQAAKNFYQFECLRDEELGKEAPRALFYVEHFAFFLNPQDSEDFFAYWLKVEIKLRKEHQSKLYAFDSDTYEREWTLVRAEYISDAKYTATRRELRPLVASDAPLVVTSLTDMTIRKTDLFAGLEISKASLARLEVRLSAGTGTFEGNAEAATGSTAAPSAAALPTMHSNGNALPNLPLPRENLRESLASTPLIFHNFADSIIARQAPPDTSAEQIELYERHHPIQR
ncbi:hypothetical protein EV359DRAFT_87321 [Lentinula novae-zelandiae]|nr:hypothetical protein EV359DRAFT_87321 [Lentinula novae-zelandiae]